MIRYVSFFIVQLFNLLYLKITYILSVTACTAAVRHL